MIVRQNNRYLIQGPVTHDTVGSLLGEGVVFEGDRIVVDFAGVTSADSFALSLMLEWTRRCHGAGKQIAFANISRNLQSLADLYGVVELLPVAVG
jgi:phospholipid transport system transporter-binding protein